MNKKQIIILSSVGGIFLATIVGLSIALWKQTDNVNFLSEQYALEKEELADEYSQLAIQYEGYKLEVNNDSLEKKLEDQRIKIQRLVEELKQTKAEDARRIASLKKELANVRGVLRYYVAQVDSLNTINEQLKAENKEVRQQINKVSTANANLQKENKQLAQKVDIASQLTATNLRAEAQNKRNRKTSSLKNTTQFVVNFTIGANVTAETGEKTIFVRILKPSEDLLTNAKSGSFEYDGSLVGYSMRKLIEYSGDELPVTLYWTRNETLDPGKYVFEVYTDGNMIGRTSLTMEK